MFNFTTVVFDGTSPTFYFTNTSGWNTSSFNLLLRNYARVLLLASKRMIERLAFITFIMGLWITRFLTSLTLVSLRNMFSTFVICGKSFIGLH